MVACATAVACGSRVDESTTGAGPAVVPTTVALVTSTTAPMRDVTQSVPVAPTSSIVTSVVTSVAPVATSVGPTSTPRSSTPSTASTSPTTLPFDKAAFCAASKVYAIDDLLGLGESVVGDPAGLLRAYDTMVGNAPPDLVEPVKALGPITREAVGLVQRGEIKTPERLQAWLADTAPRAELEQWVLAQQTIAPAVKALCA